MMNKRNSKWPANPGTDSNDSYSNLAINRRRFLQGLAVGAAVSCGASAQAMKAPGVRKRLVLIELEGGNDGLNTVVPYSQPGYYSARPVLAVPQDSVLKLDRSVGLHPELAGLMPSWEAGDLHVALGVGYPDPNRSHFRSGDIWHSASNSDELIARGWLANGFDESAVSAEGIVFGGDYGPFAKSTMSLILDNPEIFARQARNLRAPDIKTSNPALAHVVGVRQQIQRGVNDVRTVLEADSSALRQKRDSKLEQQLVMIGKMIARDANVPVFKATMTGFDTHFYQPNRHKSLMRKLGNAMSVLREQLIKSGDWNNTVVMTYSEFGRRAYENGSRGTDHGTAAPMFIMGGRVKGGFSGQQPAFPTHKNTDLEHHVDFRQIYHTVARDWLNAERVIDRVRRFERVPFLKV